MPVWVKHLSVIFSIIAIFVVWGCDSTIEKPLTKEEASNIEELQKEETKEQNSAEEKEVVSDDKESDEKMQVETSLDNDSIKLEGKKTETTSLKNSDTNTNEKGDSTKRSENVTKEKTEQSSSNKNVTNKEKNTNKPSSKNINNESNKQESSSKSSKEQKNKSESTKQSLKENVTKEKPKEANSKPKPKPKPEVKPNPEPEQSNNTIVHSIVISSNEVPLPPTEMEISKGDTVLDALIKITKAKGIQMDYRGGQGASAYVEGMANVYEFDRGPGSGWMYRVNGIFPDRGAGVVPLRPDDRVEWLYTTDLGKDLGADLKPFRR